MSQIERVLCEDMYPFNSTCLGPMHGGPGWVSKSLTLCCNKHGDKNIENIVEYHYGDHLVLPLVIFILLYYNLQVQ